MIILQTKTKKNTEPRSEHFDTKFVCISSESVDVVCTGVVCLFIFLFYTPVSAG